MPLRRRLGTLFDAPVRGELRQVFRGLHLRTHPDADSAAAKVMLVAADEIVMSDGTRITGWDRVTANITASGAGGLDTGAEAASAWYEAHAIAKSLDGAGSRAAGANDKLLLHRAKTDETEAAQQFTTASTAERALRVATATATDKLAQGFKVGTAGKIDFVDVEIKRAGAVSGRIWFTVETDTAGSPSGSVQATSDKLDASKVDTTAHWVRFIFRNPFTPADTTTQYHLVLQGDYTRSDTVNILWRGVAAGGYGSGVAKENNGAAWGNASGVGDFDFKVYTRRNDASLTFPSGYDASALLGYVYNDGSSDLVACRQIDHLARYLVENKVGTNANAYATLTDLSAFVPPVPVEILWAATTTVASAHFRWAGHLARLDSDANAIADGASVVRSGAGTETTNPQIEQSGLLVEYQHLYQAAGDAGTVHFWMRGYRW